MQVIPLLVNELHGHLKSPRSHRLSPFNFIVDKYVFGTAILLPYHLVLLFLSASCYEDADRMNESTHSVNNKQMRTKSNRGYSKLVTVM